MAGPVKTLCSVCATTSAYICVNKKENSKILTATRKLYPLHALLYQPTLNAIFYGYRPEEYT